MPNKIQRSFAAGEVAPDLYARDDLVRYATGLRTCRNMVVQRAGGAKKRTGTKFVNVGGDTGALGSTGDSWVIHAFLGSDTFVVTGSGRIEWVLVGGGGSGGSVDGSGVGAGGGGGGGVIHLNEFITTGSYAVNIGGGGLHPHADHTIGVGATIGNNGTASTFRGYTAHGGGGGGGADGTLGRGGRDGASGGGGATSGATPPQPGPGGSSTAVSPELGSPGAPGVDTDTSFTDPGGGGGGAGNIGGLGIGGVGYLSDIKGIPGGPQAEFGRGGDAVIGPGAAVTPHSGAGGQGGGQRLNSDGSDGADGSLYIRYKLSSGIVATGGTKTIIPF